MKQQEKGRGKLDIRVLFTWRRLQRFSVRC